MKNYLIVGASSGIGKALAESLSRDGHQVFGTYHNTKVESSSIQFQKFDAVNDDLDLGTLPDIIDGMVYCPGSINLFPFARIKPEDFMTDFQLNLVGIVKVIQALQPKFKMSEQASIVLFSTVAVQTGFNFHAQVAVSKGAVEGLTRSLAAEFAPKIRVNAVAPSITNTPLAEKLLNTDQKIETNVNRHPMKRIGSPDDIADMASFLLSEKSSWITGQIISVDGGMSSIKG